MSVIFLACRPGQLAPVSLPLLPETPSFATHAPNASQYQDTDNAPSIHAVKAKVFVEQHADEKVAQWLAIVHRIVRNTVEKHSPPVKARYISTRDDTAAAEDAQTLLPKSC